MARHKLKLCQKFPPPSSKNIPCLWAGQTNNGAALPWCGQPMVSIGNKWQSRQFLRKIFAATKVKRNVTTSCSFMKSVSCHVSTNFFSLHLLNEWVNQQEEAFSLYKRLITHCNLPFCICFSDKANIRTRKYCLHHDGHTISISSTSLRWAKFDWFLQSSKNPMLSGMFCLGNSRSLSMWRRCRCHGRGQGPECSPMQTGFYVSSHYSAHDPDAVKCRC